MAIPWAKNSLHVHLIQLFKKWFLYLVWQLFWLLFKNWANFCKSSGHPAPVPVIAGFEPLNLRLRVNWSTTELPNLTSLS
jgi:hypothetical protein